MIRLLLIAFIFLVIIVSLFAPKPDTQTPAPNDTLLDPEHPERGTIGENIAKVTKVEHIPSKPWVLMGWSAANRPFGYKQQWMPYDYYHRKADCLAARQSMINYDQGTADQSAALDHSGDTAAQRAQLGAIIGETAADDASSKCVQVGEEIPLKWQMLLWHLTKHRWIKFDRFTTKAECEANLHDDIRGKCVPLQ